MAVYTEHPDCKSPSEDAVIWRYMDLPRFLSLLQRQALFFTTIKRLKLLDPYEGVLSTPTKTFPRLPSLAEETKFIESGYLSDSQISNLQFHIEHGEPLIKNFVAVNCWHINDFESAAMWQLYSNYNQGIAIQSTFSRLRECFMDTKETPRFPEGEIVPISIGMVDYLDYAKDRNNFGSLFPICLTKRRSYEHERELRAITLLPWSNDYSQMREGVSKNMMNDFTTYDGVYFPVDLNHLIEKVFIAPNAPKWFAEIIKSTGKKYKLSAPLKQSNLLTDIY
jgi:hypothetical protein